MKQLALYPHGITGELPPPAPRPRPPRERVFRQQFREFKWPPGPRPWTGEVVRIDIHGMSSPVEVLGVHGSERDVVELDAGGLREGDVHRVPRSALQYEDWPRFIFRLLGRARWYVDANVYVGGGERTPGYSKIMTPADEALAAQRDTERYLERGLPWRMSKEGA